MQSGHANDHIFAGDEEPFSGNMSLEVTGKFHLMGDGGSIEHVVSIDGIDGSGEKVSGEIVIFNECGGNVGGRCTRIKEGFNGGHVVRSNNNLKINCWEES